MKINRKILWMGLSSLLFVACSGDDTEMESLPVQELTDIRISAPDFLWEKNSRLISHLGDKGFSMEWETRDTLGILPNEGGQVSFPIMNVDPQRPNYARFTGGGWALKPSSSYAAYYPYIGDGYLDKKHIDINYGGQWQQQNDGLDHLERYIYMAAQATTPVEGTVDFNFQHLGCYTIFEIATPEPTAFSSVTFCTEEKLLVEQAVLDLSQSSPALSPVGYVDSLTFSLEGVETTADQLQLKIMFMFAPTKLAGKKFKAVLRDVDGYEEEVQIEGRDMQAGIAYKYPALQYVTYPTVAKPNWTFDEQNNPYQMGMTAIVTVPGSMRKLMGEGDELAAFVNGELRGVGQLVDGIYYLLVHGNIGETGKVSFRYFNQKKSYMYEAKDMVDFNTEEIFGVTENPVELPLVRVDQ